MSTPADGPPGGSDSASPDASVVGTTRALIACAAAHYTAVTGFRVGIALAAVHLGLAPASIGLVLATFALVPMLLAVRGGQIVDRIGVRTPMIAGTAVAALGALACAAVPHPAMFAVSAGVVGLGMMSFHLGMQHAAGEIGGPARRTANFNLLTMGFSVSGMLGPSLIGIVIDVAGHRAAFALTAALLGAVLIALRRLPLELHLPAPATRPLVDEDDPPAPARPEVPPVDAADGPGGGEPSPDGSRFALLGAPRLRRLLAASLLASASWDVYQFVVPLHAASMGLSAASVGFALSAFSAGSLTVRLMLPRLVTRMAPARWMQVALAICVLAYVAAPYASRLDVLLALSFLIGIGPGIAQPLLMAALHGAAPAGRVGEAAGLRMTLLSAMQLALPVALGVVAGALGTASLFWLYAITAAGIGIALARAHGR